MNISEAAAFDENNKRSRRLRDWLQEIKMKFLAAKQEAIVLKLGIYEIRI